MKHWRGSQPGRWQRQSIPFSAFWLRSSVVSVLISLISDTRFIEPHDINLIFCRGAVCCACTTSAHAWPVHCTAVQAEHPLSTNTKSFILKTKHQLSDPNHTCGIFSNNIHTCKTVVLLTLQGLTDNRPAAKWNPLLSRTLAVTPMDGTCACFPCRGVAAATEIQHDRNRTADRHTCIELSITSEMPPR